MVRHCGAGSSVRIPAATRLIHQGGKIGAARNVNGFQVVSSFDCSIFFGEEAADAVLSVGDSRHAVAFVRCASTILTVKRLDEPNECDEDATASTLNPSSARQANHKSMNSSHVSDVHQVHREM